MSEQPPRLADTDEFRFGIWWVPDEAQPVKLRNATLGECAAEIIRLREALAVLAEDFRV
jgi:hypothetical protein